VAAKCNVAFVVNNLDVGGLEKVVIQLIRHLDRTVFEPLLVCIDGPGALFAEAGLPSHRCLVLDKSRARSFGPVRFDPRLLLQIARFFRGNHVHIAHAHNAAPLIYGGFAARMVRPRPVFVYSEHNQIYSASPASRRKFRWYVRLADRVVAVSHDLRSTLRAQVGITTPVRVIHNGIDGSRFSSLNANRIRHTLGLSDSDLVVGTAVVISKQKGLTHLLDAACTVVTAEPRARFVVAGDGPLRADLERKASSLGLGDRFRFLGYRSDIPELIASLDLYVLPSLWEGLPLALLEALAMGKPIVATSVGGNPEVVEDGVQGRLVPPGDSVALADAILALLRDDEFRASVGPVNRAKFERQFSVQAMVRAHEALYSAICRA